MVKSIKDTDEERRYWAYLYASDVSPSVLGRDRALMSALPFILQAVTIIDRGHVSYETYASYRNSTYRYLASSVESVVSYIQDYLDTVV